MKLAGFSQHYCRITSLIKFNYDKSIIPVQLVISFLKLTKKKETQLVCSSTKIKKIIYPCLLQLQYKPLPQTDTVISTKLRLDRFLGECHVAEMSVSRHRYRLFELRLHQYVVPFSKTLNPHCFSRLSCEMSARREHPCEECLFIAMSFPE